MNSSFLPHSPTPDLLEKTINNNLPLPPFLCSDNTQCTNVKENLNKKIAELIERLNKAHGTI